MKFWQDYKWIKVGWSRFRRWNWRIWWGTDSRMRVVTATVNWWPRIHWRRWLHAWTILRIFAGGSGRYHRRPPTVAATASVSRWRQPGWPADVAGRCEQLRPPSADFRGRQNYHCRLLVKLSQEWLVPITRHTAEYRQHTCGIQHHNLRLVIRSV